MSDPRATYLDRLASRVGILPEYIDQTGTEVRRAPDQTRVAILRAMGLDGSTETAARASLAELRRRERQQVLEPVRVVPRGRAAARARLRTGAAAGREIRWEATLTLEQGEVRALHGVATVGRGGWTTVALGTPLAEGYHSLRVTIIGPGAAHEAEQSLVVVPRASRRIRPAWGVIANLYTVRGAGDWGVGDFSTLGALLEWTASRGGAFVGVNPLHALRNRGWDVSPYSPVSRLFRNPLYLDPAAVSGVDAGERALLQSPEVLAERSALRTADAVEYERVLALKRRVLERLHAGLASGDQYRRYLKDQGEALDRFAVFETLADHLDELDWRRWPEPYRDPGSSSVAAFRADRAGEVEFHRWVQFELERQLGAAAERGRRAGLALGVYQDLAIGTSASGADVWANPHLFLTGLSIGAPPDDLGPEGQNWGLPPMDPRTLREDRYRFWIRLLRASFAHAGALRIDHVLGLFRQFWIPEGAPGSAGAYVRFPVDDLLGILLLEAERHDAVVVGEDLGTVPPEVPPALARRRILSSRVFYFEREGDRYRAAAEYQPASLATANTHDLPPIAGFWAGRDIALRRQIGAIGSDEDAARAMEDRARMKRGILERLAEDGVLESAADPADGAELRGAVHAFLCRTPAALVGINLDDLLGETEPVNLPGVMPDRYRSWTRKLAVPVESLDGDPGVSAALQGVRRA